MKSIRRWLHTLVARIYYFIGASYRYFGNTYGLMSEYENAIDALSRAITWNPSFARAYMERGILYWREMDHPRRAIMDLTTAYTLDPSLAEARFNRGIAYQQLREYDRAIVEFKAYLATGNHPYWREYAESMIRELHEWAYKTEAAD
jgi:tetratricopeptide (TPR) repeat protein